MKGRLAAAAGMLGCLFAVLRLAVVPALAAPPPAPADSPAIVTLQIEDSGLTGNDRSYTAGERLDWTSPTGDVAGPLARFGHDLWGEGQQRLTLGLSQRIYTPQDTQVATPSPFGHPYAGLLLGRIGLIQDSATTRNTLELSLGVIGPAAQAEAVQNGVHRLIGQATIRGWDAQLPNQPVVELLAARIWRVGLGRAGGLDFDALPAIAAGAGTWRVYGQAGILFRLGQGLGSDFGPARLRPGLTGGDAYAPTRRFVWYVFAGADGQAVAWDETLQGEPFRSTAHVTPDPLVGELEAGAAMIFHGVRVSLTHVVQTRTFRGQTGVPFQFDSVSVSIPF